MVGRQNHTLICLH